MRTLEQRFTSYFTKSDGCWLWVGAKDNHGYGVINDGTGRHRIVRAHRLSWTIFRGEIPKGSHVLHACDTPLCVNPEHLFIGDQRTNMADRTRKGRAASGEKAGPTKLTQEKVTEIFAQAGNVSQRILAERFGVHPSAISRILSGENWKYHH